MQKIEKAKHRIDTLVHTNQCAMNDLESRIRDFMKCDSFYSAARYIDELRHRQDYHSGLLDVQRIIHEIVNQE